MASVRSNVAVAFDGQEYLLTPNFKAWDAIEAATGKGLIEVLNDISALKAGTTATVLFCAFRANGFTKVTREALGEAIQDSLSEDDMPLIKAAVEFLNGYLSKGKAGEGDASEPKKPAKAKATS